MKPETVMQPRVTVHHRSDAARPGRDDLELLILAALERTPEMSWSELREALPGTQWQRTRALVSLHDRGVVHTVKLAGQTFVASALPIERSPAA